MSRRIRWKAAFAMAMAGACIAAAQTDGSLKWSFATQGLILSSPAIGSDGTLYVGSESRRIWAINPNGTLKWRWPEGLIPNPPVDWFDAAPAVADDGTIYAGNFDGKFYAVNPNGTLKWSYDTASYIVSSAAIATDGTLYFGAGDGNLHAVNPNGTNRWTFPTGDWVDASPAIGPDGTVVVGSWDGNVYAVNPDGTLKWSVSTGDAIQSSPAIGPDGSVYIGSGDGRLYAITSGGTVAWSFLTGDTVDTSPAVGPDGTIYFGSADGKFYALKPDGTPAWAAPYNAGQAIFGSAVVRADGTIIFGTSDRRIHALNADGSVKWTYTTGDVVDSSPAIGTDGTIYIGSSDNRLYALNGNGAGTSDAPWPKFRRNAGNTGRAPETPPVAPPTIDDPPQSQTVPFGKPVTFSVAASGSQPLGFQWLKGGAEITGATTSSLTIAQTTLTDAGSYSVRVSNTAGSVMSQSATLAVNPPVAPTITVQPRPLTVGPGARVSLWVTAAGSEPFSYQWFHDGVAVAGATGVFYEVTSAQAADAGSYSVTVSNAGGSISSDAATVAVVSGTTSRLLNLSTRAFVDTGESILIPGLVVTGIQPRRLLVRAVGPTLATFNVGGTLADPQFTILSEGVALASNNDWHLAANAAEIALQGDLIGAFPLLAESADAAALVDLAPGGYTIQVSGVGGATGIALVEVYDVDPAGAASGRLVNISTRADSGTGDSVMIPGFVVQGDGARTLLIRAVGPTLSQYGVQNFLPNPILRLFDEEGEILANETWTTAPDVAALSAATSLVGAFDLENNSADAAILVVLMPGAYTAQATSSDGTTGNVLVEVYEVP